MNTMSRTWHTISTKCSVVLFFSANLILSLKNSYILSRLWLFLSCYPKNSHDKKVRMIFKSQFEIRVIFRGIALSKETLG